MHSALFVAHPKTANPKWEKFLEFVDAKLMPLKGVARLAENVWLVDFHRSPTALGWLTSLADQQTIAYGLLQFEQKPEWLPVGFDPTSIVDQSVA